ncbi:terminase TerL endonuclease subunit [Jeotgalicoccus halotolerans]|uniref:terminase large subunit n=1 Tax=Jeotgalicoccus halotolerans TaxID=157227 RepID=UPI00351199A7
MVTATEKNLKGAGRPYNPENFDYVTYYAEQVAAGKIIASKKNIASAKRHLDDLKVQNVLNYYWKPEEAAKVIKFVEMLPDVSTGKPMPLMLFQKYILGSIYGWRDKDNKRRFTQAYISTARKQGKSIINAGIALYELLLGETPQKNRQIYIAARTMAQAKIIYEMAYSQLNILKQDSPTLRRDLQMRKTDIVHTPSNSIFKGLSTNPNAIDGLNPSVIQLDEWATVADDEMYTRLKTGMGLQPNPLTIFISTVSDNMNSPMYQEYQYISKLLNKQITNENYFVFAAEMDSEEEVNDESLWIKAMPLLESEKHYGTILRNIKSDIEKQREKGDESGVLIKNFNLWGQSSKNEFISPKSWQAASTDEPIDVTSTDCIVGLDLSSVDDLTAVSFAHMLDSKKIYVDSHAFVSTRMPIDLKIKRDKTDYLKLEQEGYVTISRTESGVIDYGEVIDYLLKYEKTHNLNIKEVVYDPYNIGQFFQAIEHKNKTENANIKWTFVEQSQQMYKLSPIIKQFRIDIWNKKIIHSNNPILNIAVNNAVSKEELNNNIRVSKKNRSSKIDPLAALFNAHASAMHMEFKPKSISEKIREGKFSF